MKKTTRPTKKRAGVRRWRHRRRPLTKARIAAIQRREFQTRYTLTCLYRGYDGALDRQLERAVGRKSVGSGMDMLIGMRDLDFEFRTEKQANRAVERVRGERIRGLRLMMSGRWRP